MTEKQKRFCDEYLIDSNGTRAYKAAYPSVKNDDVAAACSYKLLRNAQIKSYLDERLEQLHNERTATAQEVVEFLSATLRDKGETSQNRLKAAELLGKRYGLFTDKVAVSGSGVVQIVDDVPDG